MTPDEPMECQAHQIAPDYRAVFDDAYQLALKLGDPQDVAEQIAADAASEFLHPQRRLRAAKVF